MYIFHLGNHTDLAKAEIENYLQTSTTELLPDALLVDDLHREPQEILDNLGGTIKISQVIAIETYPSEEYLIDLISSMIIAGNHGEKAHFGLSSYSGDYNSEELGMSIKRKLQESDISARLTVSKNPTLSAGDIKRNKLLKKGSEFVLLESDKKTYIAETRAIQAIEDWSFRDMKRPGRDAKRGMLPPKLARIMVNLAGPKGDNEVLLDAFCGSGTVIMEGMLGHFDELIAADKSERAVQDTKKLVNWTKENFNLEPEVMYFASTAENLGHALQAESVSRIISEVFLGQPKKGSESRHKLETEMKELQAMYERSVKSLAQAVRPRGKMVFAMPVFAHPEGDIELNYKKIVDGAEVVMDRPPLRYEQPNQKVKRDILILEKK